MKLLSAAVMAGMLAGALPAAVHAQQPQTAQTAQSARYSVTTTLIGTLLDDPAAAAVLERMIPTVYANDMFRSMGRDQTLKGVQQFEGAVLTDQMLAAIQVELDKLTPSK